MSARRLALLRGVNVGGKNRLSMKDLVGLFEMAGAVDVSTYIQSGNVLFSAPEKRMPEVEAEIVRQVEHHLGKPIPVIFRSPIEMNRVLQSNPFLETDTDENRLFVMFLRDESDPGAVAGLDPNRSSPDTYRVIDREIYLNIQTSAADTKLSNQYFDSRLRTISSSRNWRTVSQLAKLLEPTG